MQGQQVFYWVGAALHTKNDKVYYQSFQLNGLSYTIGDSVYLFPETESSAHYIGRIVSAFVDEHSGHADPHCIEVKWYERRVNLEESTRGIEESEREVFELEDIDVNPIGCISGKTNIIRARAYDEAAQRMRSTSEDWYFCRGYFLQTSNSFQPYTDLELTAITALHTETEEQESAAQSQPGSANGNKRERGAAAPKKKVTGRVCVQCGATSTPQWREGPTGPKTLCNACGVRYGRAQAKAQKNKAGATAGASNRAQNAATPSSGGRGGGGGGKGKKGANKDMEHLQVSLPQRQDTPTQRPLRQAAQASLARTAAYARTGEFGDGDEEGDAGGAGPLDADITGQVLDVGENGAFSAQTQLPIAALEIPPVMASLGSRAEPVGGSQPHAAAALPGGAQQQPPHGAGAGVPLPPLSTRCLPPGRGPSPTDAARHPSPLLKIDPLAPPQLPPLFPTTAVALASPTHSVSSFGVRASARPPQLNPPFSLPKLSSAPPQDPQTVPFTSVVDTTGGDARLFSAFVSAGSPQGQTAAATAAAVAAAADVTLMTPPLHLTAHQMQHAVADNQQQQPLKARYEPQDVTWPLSARSSQSGVAPWLIIPATQQRAQSLDVPLSLDLPPPRPLDTGTAPMGLSLDTLPGVVATQAASAVPELASLQALFADIDALPSGTLPADVLSTLNSARARVILADRESEAAQAAVAAVSKVFVERQAAADRARALAEHAGRQLKDFLLTTLGQRGVSLPIPHALAPHAPGDNAGDADTSTPRPAALGGPG